MEAEDHSDMSEEIFKEILTFLHKVHFYQDNTCAQHA